jgi:hypothetical protein
MHENLGQIEAALQRITIMDTICSGQVPLLLLHPRGAPCNMSAFNREDGPRSFQHYRLHKSDLLQHIGIVGSCPRLHDRDRSACMLLRRVRALLGELWRDFGCFHLLTPWLPPCPSHLSQRAQHTCNTVVATRTDALLQ